MDPSDYFSQITDMENENLHDAFQGINLLDEDNANDPHLFSNIFENNIFNDFNNQPSPYPAFFNQNPDEPVIDLSEQFETSKNPPVLDEPVTDSTEQFETPKSPLVLDEAVINLTEQFETPESPPVLDETVIDLTEQFETPESPESVIDLTEQFETPESPPTVIDLTEQFEAPESPPAFFSQNNQINNSYNARNLRILDQMSPNPYDEQVYRPVLPDPEAPSSPISIPFAATTNLFGPESSPLPGFPQPMVPNGHGQQTEQSGASMQQRSQGLPNLNNQYNGRMNMENLQWESNTSLQANNSWILGDSSDRAIERRNSQVSNIRLADTVSVPRFEGLPNQNMEYNPRMNAHNLQRESNTSSQVHNSSILGHSNARDIGGLSSQVSNMRLTEIAPVSRPQGLPDQSTEYNRRMNMQNLPWESNTSSQAHNSTILGQSSIMRNEGTGSQVSNTGLAEIAPVLRPQGLSNQFSELNPGMNVPNLHRESNTSSQAQNSRILDHSGIRAVFQETNSQVSNIRRGSTAAGSRPSEGIRRILNLNPTRMVMHNSINSMQFGTGALNFNPEHQLPLYNEYVRYVPPRRGRPRKRSDDDLLAAVQAAKLRRLSSRKGKATPKTSTSEQPHQTPDRAVNSDENATLANSSDAPREFVNGAYDLEFETNGLPIDPHLRFFRPPSPPPPAAGVN